MNLQEFFDYKNRLMEDLVTSNEIMQLVDDEGNYKDDYSQLAYKQLFPYEYLPETADSGFTYICFDVDVQKYYDKTFLMPVLYIWVFSHRSRLRVPGEGIRPDMICAKICEKINGSLYYGLGELELYSVKRFAPMTDYQGKYMTFYAKDFSRVFKGNKSIPVNRKNP